MLRIGMLLVAGCWLLVAGCWLLVAGCWLLLLLLPPPPLPLLLLLQRLACDLTSPLAPCAPFSAYLVRAAGPYILVGGRYTSGMKNSNARGYSDVVDIFHAGTGEHPAKPRAY